MPPGVLFLCAASSARSQLAEALARKRFGDRIRIQSASSHPVNPMALLVLAEDEVDASAQASTPVESIDPATVDLVVTLCAEAVCPASLSSARRLHWRIRDPVADVPPGELRNRFRMARRRILARLDAIEAALAMPPRIEIVPSDEADRLRVAVSVIAQSSIDLGSGKQSVIARLDGAVVGRAVIEVDHESGHAVLHEISVVEAHRRRGIGRALVADRVAWAKSLAIAPHGHGVVASISANLAGAEAGAEHFFERCGFVREGERLLHRVYFTNQELLANGIAAELTEHGTMVPPFVKYPDIPCMSIGWRMGEGEWYLWMWNTWFNALDAASRAAYLATWEPQAPDDWIGWMDDESDDANVVDVDDIDDRARGDDN
jgi:arsenate reductase